MAEPQQQSRHFARIDLIGVKYFPPFSRHAEVAGGDFPGESLGHIGKGLAERRGVDSGEFHGLSGPLYSSVRSSWASPMWALIVSLIASALTGPGVSPPCYGLII